MSDKLLPGTRVRMTRAFRTYLRWSPGNRQHVREFGRCIGIVQGPCEYSTEYGEIIHGPEVNVRWQPSNLRYGYNPKYLEIVK